jgi:hypothetical protein
VIILTRIKFHTIFHACTSLLDKYCEKGTCNYRGRKLKKQHGVVGQCFPVRPWGYLNCWDSVFPFGRKGLIRKQNLPYSNETDVRKHKGVLIELYRSPMVWEQLPVMGPTEYVPCPHCTWGRTQPDSETLFTLFILLKHYNRWSVAFTYMPIFLYLYCFVWHCSLSSDVGS